MLISAHWDSVRASLPHPESIWRWGDLDVPHKVLYNWKWTGLVTCVDEREKLWRTSMRLWAHVIGKAGDDEHVGEEASMQELLPTGLDPHAPRDRDDSPGPSLRPPSRDDGVQVTLTGDTVDTNTHVDEQTLQANKQKGEQDSGRDVGPGQLSLSTAALLASEWDVTVRWFRASPPRSRGSVY